MPPRNRRPPCHNCPKARAEQTQPEPKRTPKQPPQPAAAVTPLVGFPDSEALRLWNHILFGTGSCIGMIEGYTTRNLYGDPLEGIKHLRDRLNAVIQIHEDRSHAPDSPHQ